MMDSKVNMLDRLLLWEHDDDPLAPLNDIQKQSIEELESASRERPLPKQLPIDDDVYVQPNLGLLKTDDESTNINVSGKVIESTQQFLLWNSEVERKVVQDGNMMCQVYVEELLHYHSHCTQLLENVTLALELLESLQKKYTFVSDKTNALHEACEHLLAEQAKLVNSAETISQKLCYFNELDLLSQKLASPTLSVVNESFIPLLSRLDECIAYMVSNEHFKEAHMYLVRFRHLQTTALGMVRTFVVSTLQQTTQQVLPKRDTLAPSENAFTLYYGKFRSRAPRIRSLMKQIEERAEKNSDYQPLLDDCHQCYFTQRDILLGPSVSAAITDLASNHVKDHCSLVRSGCAFLLHVCEDEYQLFRQFFSVHSKQLQEFLESLCMRLYDVLRPIFIHINHLETLAELCGILKVEMLEEHMQYGAHELEAFEAIIRQMLEDVQERLVYRTHIYMRTDILQYEPAAGDLAYPDKLEMMESIAQSLAAGSLSRSTSQISLVSSSSAAVVNTEEKISEIKDPQPSITAELADGSDNESVVSEKSSVSRKSRSSRAVAYSSADLHGMWYPTVRRTLVCLSKLYRCLDKTIFQGLSQEVLTSCIQSLVSATATISKNKTPLDGQLFQIKHLLILREQIAPFQIDFAIKETTLDFSHMKVAAYGLLQKKSQLLSLNSNNAILEFLLQGAPHMTEHFIDSKKAIDKQLKVICEDFIEHLFHLLAGPVQEFLEKVKKFEQMQTGGKTKEIRLHSQPFASADNLSQLVTNSNRTIKTVLPSLLRSMSLYLANEDTEYILFRPVKIRIQTSFEQLLQLIRVNYSEEEQIIIACPSPEQVTIMLSPSLAKA